ncbi:MULTISPECIES: hypothetical protein [unclassified Rhizobium]|uniref:hypothetical protein n=1 Tax=unclassified Rhizobium TaxID=2613769 RepID=UPI0037F7E849
MSDAEGSKRDIDAVFLRILARGNSSRFKFLPPPDDPVGKVIESIAAEILAFCQTTSDAELSERVSPRRISVRMVPLGDVSALTLYMGSSHIIAFNQGVALYLYRLARAMTPYVIVRGTGDAPPPPESEAVAVIAVLLDWMSSLVRAPLVDAWETGPREQRTAENYARMAERFVLSHEIAHIMREHLVGDAGTAPQKSLSLHDLDRRPVVQEHEADAIGAMLAVDSSSAAGIDPRAAVAGVRYFFEALKLCEAVGAVHIDDAHRPAAERSALCDQVMSGRYGRVPNLHQAADQTSDLLRRLGSAALEERQRRRVTVAARIENLLANTSWHFGSNDPAVMRSIFDEAKSMFASSPSAVIDALQSTLLDAQTFEQLMRTAKSPEALEQDDRLRRHRIAHFIARNAPLPVRDALGVGFP